MVREREADHRKITLLVTDNPKQPGSKAHKRFELYKFAKTVNEFYSIGGERCDIEWDENHKYIKLG